MSADPLSPALPGTGSPPAQMGSMESALAAVLLTGIALALGAAIHWGLRRLARRLPRRLGGGGRPPETILRWERWLHLAVLPVKLGLWGAVMFAITEWFPALRHGRATLVWMIEMSVERPLFTLQGRGYTVLDLLTVPVLLVAVWAVVSVLARLLRSQVLAPLRVERGVEEAVALVFRVVAALIGGLVLLQVWGIDVSSLTIVASVLGVGIGFGLQNIANNFVSGVVLNLEHPIRPGDFVQIGELSGTVERVGARCTEIRTLDRVAILVPNSRLLEAEVINWSHGDPVSRLHLPVGVAYGSDPRQVRVALLEAVQGHPKVRRDPRPAVEFKGFGDSALNFELLFWIDEPRLQNRLRSDVYFLVEASLRRHGLEIPFPQRDLHLRTPQLDQLLAAWGQPEAVAAAGTEVSAPPCRFDAAAVDGLLDDAGSPRAWPAERIDAVLREMRGPTGVEVRDRRHLRRQYARCFVGSEAVDWWIRTASLTRAEAVELGEVLVERDIIHHVLDEHGFRDGHFYYRFFADEPA